MNLEKYKTDGWGLSELSLKKIIEIINSINNNKIKVIEFGSGKSTEFLVDFNNELKKNIIITTFDNDLQYAYKKKDNDGVILHIRELLECNDNNYNTMFTNKIYDKSLMHEKKTPLTTKQKNNFYDIKKGDIVGKYDLMILDGPNGNGRNISYLHMKKHLKSGSYVLIDDYHHYDFVDKFLTIFDAELIFEHNDRRNGGEFVIYKIK
jgi:hypothetical protein